MVFIHIFYHGVRTDQSLRDHLWRGNRRVTIDWDQLLVRSFTDRRHHRNLYHSGWIEGGSIHRSVSDRGAYSGISSNHGGGTSGGRRLGRTAEHGRFRPFQYVASDVGP